MKATAEATHGGSVPLPVVSAPLAFDAVFRAEAPHVGRTLRYLGVSEASLDDACQEVFLVVHRRLAEFSHGSLRAWIRQICVFVAQNQRRALRRRREDATDDTPDVAAPPTQHGEVERRELRDRLLVLLDALPEEQRTVFVLYEVEQLGMAEVAEAVSCPLQTAYSRLHAARAKMKAGIEGDVR
jgi:RNA polymerase sigma-70 factor (ECF subfamily)